MSDKPQGRVNPIQVQKFLKGINYPVSKQDLLKTAESHGADEKVMNTLKQLPDKSFDAPTDVTKEIGKIK